MGEDNADLNQKVANLTQDVDALRAIVLSVGELICQSITRLPQTANPVLESATPLLLVTTADAEVTHAQVV